MRLHNIPVCHDPDHDGSEGLASHHSVALQDCQQRCRARGRATGLYETGWLGAGAGAGAELVRGNGTGLGLRVGDNLITDICLAYSCNDGWEPKYMGCLCDTFRKPARGQHINFFELFKIKIG